MRVLGQILDLRSKKSVFVVAAVGGLLLFRIHRIRKSKRGLH